MAFAMFLHSYRSSLGDWKLNTFNLPDYTICKVAWFLWLSQMVLQFFLLMNFAIQIAEGGYGSVKEVQMEEAYQKKCTTICELKKVFGKIATRKPTNILVTRETLRSPDDDSKPTETIVRIKKQQVCNKIDTLTKVNKLR